MFGHPTICVLLAAALLVAGCDGGDEDTTTGDGPASDPPATPPEEQEPVLPADDEPPPPRVDDRSRPQRVQCRHDGLEAEPLVLLTGSDPAAVASQVAGRTHRCAPVAVVAPTDGVAAAVAVPVAIAADAPLLLLDTDDPSGIDDVVDGLAVDELVTVGIDANVVGWSATTLSADSAATDGSEGGTLGPAGDPTADADPDDAALVPPPPAPGEAAAPSELPDQVALALAVADHLGTDRFIAVREGDVRDHAAAAVRADGSTALLPVPGDHHELAHLARRLPATARVQVVEGATARTLADELLAVGIDAEVMAGERWPEGGATSWLVDPEQPATTAVAAVAAAGRDEPVLPIDSTDLRSGHGRTARIRDAAAERLVVVGDTTPEASWQLDVVRHGPPLPAGGFKLFEDERLVALYGSPVHPSLGALGEQDLDATVERSREVAEPYAADGLRVVPTFELIATVASRNAEPTGDYSERTDLEILRPYIERAAQEGFYVVLDLQPGRTDFLEQAREYEEFLVEPHVGLALDPEWRIGPDEVHLERIGHVEVEEVQRVADWLAELTREHRLPEKLLMLHQFTDAMLPGRDQLEVPPELAVVIHMDGQGSLAAKYDTYDAITRDAEGDWVWGWKNFYDEDQPPATPEEVLELDPLPMVVTYQ